MLEALLILLSALQGYVTLRLLGLDIPGSVIRGDPVWLNCTFDLEKDELYSIKWYKNNVEFYRYLPPDSPPAQKYDLKGIYLDVTMSSHGHIYLYKTDLNSEGTYRCEVSAESPSFQTVRDEKDLRVYVLLDHGPLISGTKAQYQVGDLVNVSCTAGPSKPAPVLRWYINQKEAPAEFEIRSPPVSHEEGLEISTVGLTFVAEPTHFWEGNMKLLCRAIISQAYSSSSKEIVASKNSKTAGFHSGSAGDGPTITGGHLRYQVGDVVDINCTAPKSRPAAELKWYVTDKEMGPEFLLHYPTVRYSDGQEASSLGLRFTVRPWHFHRDQMRLKCTSTLLKITNMSSEETMVSSRYQSPGLHMADRRGAVPNGSTSSVLLMGLLCSLHLGRIPLFLTL